MNVLIQKLIHDHHNIQTVQRILRSNILQFWHAGTEPKLGLWVDAMAYLKTYPELVHHPLEDRIYAVMQAVIKDAFLIEKLEEIEQQHTEMASASAVVLAHFYDLLDGNGLPTANIVEKALDYIALAERHLICENTYLFPAISQYLSEYDLAVISLELNRRADPLFSEPRDHRFNRLYHTIVDKTQSADSVLGCV